MFISGCRRMFIHNNLNYDESNLAAGFESLSRDMRANKISGYEE
jgi:hypothetical protein